MIVTDAKECLNKYKSELEQAIVASRGKKGQFSIAMPFDAVVLNHRVSDTDGIQVAKEILLLHPAQRVVFISESAIFTAELQNEFGKTVDITQKPLVPEALIELLENSEIYHALEKMGVNVQKLREGNLHHFQLSDLLARCISILEDKKSESSSVAR